MSLQPEFEVVGNHKSARSANFKLPRHTVKTPVFMPVGTQGTIKGLTSKQLLELDLDIILGNTYHLGLRPGKDIMDEFGGLHKLMNWPHSILTDSGGFQMVSLLKLATITEEGVEFLSSHDGSKIMMTPEESIRLQNSIGSDIMMQLDDVVHVSTRGPRVEEAMNRSIRWLDRSIAANNNPDKQTIFAIIQGGLNLDLRTTCMEEMVKRNTGGYAIGGLSGGESKDEFWRVVAHCTKHLPKDKPRYCMGVGYPVDLVVCTALGVDMFDCVYPCRTARFGTALVSTGRLQLKQKEFRDDLRRLDENCDCYVCKNYTRAYFHSLSAKEQIASNLLTYHNLYYLKHLMTSLREAIVEERFPERVQQFFQLQFPEKDYPNWVVEALASVDITLPT
eukprot:TRINITY_DN56093_c0_g1_i1.p1 TRINITY_DN56093_c0_g1~~TRINITY_DN56093_c0_g1_i1.p1  ORF type:complete len:391 (+),score=8.02 TRINITY_DN56093_c0_g1_i1:31-1203(+)